MKDTFKNFSGQDYIDGACLTLENAKKHVEASKSLVESDNIGIAISHLILGAEEFIKAFILLCLSGDSHFINDDEKIELFWNHRFKHKHISLFLNAISDSEAANFEQKFFDRFIKNEPQPSIYSVDGHYINSVFKLVSLDSELHLRLDKWLTEANNQKNNGFYVGVTDNWNTPATFNKVDYDKAFECVSILENAISPLFDWPLTDDDFIDYLNRDSDSFF